MFLHNRFSNIRISLWEKICLTSVIAIIIYTYIGWFQPGIVFANDFQIRPEEYFMFYLDPQTWFPLVGGGHYMTGTNAVSVPVFSFAAILSKALDYALVQKLVWLWPFPLVGFLSSYHLLKRFVVNKYAIYLGSLVFVVNPFISSRLSTGQAPMVMAYALLPLIFLLYIRALTGKNMLAFSLLTALALSVSFWYEIRIGVLALFPLLLYTIYYVISNKQQRFVSFIRVLKVLAILCPTVVTLNMFWLGMMFWYPSEVFANESASFSSVSGVSKYAGTLFNVIQLYPTGFEDFYTIASIGLPIIAFSVLLTHHRRNYLVISLLISSLILIFLGKGGYPPGGDLYVWLVLSTPLAIAYRNPNKIWFLLSLLYSIFVAFSIDGFSKVLNLHKNWRGNISFSAIITCLLVMVVLSQFFLSINYAMLWSLPISEKETFDTRQGSLSIFNPVQKQDIRDVYDAWEFVKDNSTPASRTLWLPTIHNFRFASEDHPLLYSNTFIDPALPYTNFVVSGPNGFLRYNDTGNQELANILAIGRIENIVLLSPDLPNWDFAITPYESFLQILGHQKGIHEVEVISNNTATPTSVSPNIQKDQNEYWIRYNNDEEQTATFKFEHPDSALLSLLSFDIRGDRPETINILIKDAHQQIIADRRIDLNTTNWDNVQFNLGKRSGQRLFQLQPFDSVMIRGNNLGEIVHIRDFKLQSGTKVFKISNVVPTLYLASVVEPSENEIKSLNNADFQKSNLTKFAFIDSNSTDKDIRSEILRTINGTNYNEAFRWQKISPSHYEAQINNKSPVVLVFTEAYDKYWKLYVNDQEQPSRNHFVVNGYANGFYIDKVGKKAIIIEHSPQHFFHTNFQNSMVGVLAIVGFVLFEAVRKFIRLWHWKDITRHRRNIS